MRDRRSYLETVNAGRKRRGATGLDQLNATIAGLERQLDEIGSVRNTARRERPRAAPRPATYNPHEDLSRRPQTVAPNALEQTQKMLLSLTGEMARLREDVAKAHRAPPSALGERQLRDEFARLYDRLDQEAAPLEQADPTLLHLQDDIGDLKRSLDRLAREDSVRSIDSRWRDFENRFDAFNQTVVDQMERPRHDPSTVELSRRLDDMRAQLDALPDALPLSALDRKMEHLSGIVERMSKQKPPVIPPVSFDAVDRRLDEISRAIVALSVIDRKPASIDSAPIDRIEARLNALSEQLTALGQNETDDDAITDRLDALAERIEAASQQADAGPIAENLKRISAQLGALSTDTDHSALDRLEALAERLDAASQKADAGPIAESLERISAQLGALSTDTDHSALDRLEALAERLENQLPGKADDGLVAERLSQLTERLDHAIRSADDSDEDLMTRVDGRLQAMEHRLASNVAKPFDHDALVERIEARMRELNAEAPTPVYQASAPAMEKLESRLDEIVSKLDAASRHAGPGDSDALMALENQIAALSSHLTGTRSNEFEQLSPRLASIETMLSDSRESLIDAAQTAAENASRSIPDGGSDQEIAALTDEFRNLESLARKSDERNTKTFSAIHDTLLKIVERLSTLQAPIPAAEESRDTADKRSEPIRPNRIDLGVPVAKLAPEDHNIGTKAPPAPSALPRKKALTPAGAAAAAAQAAVDGMQDDAPAMFAEDYDGNVDFDLPLGNHAQAADAGEFDDSPIAPGGGAPDLSAIMQRVKKDKQAKPNRLATDASQSDFLAAARRAAQAAAAEAEILKRDAESQSSTGRFNLSGLFARRRKPILLGIGAIFLAFAGLQLGNAYLGAGAPVEIAENTVIEPAGEVQAEAPVVRVIEDNQGTLDEPEQAPVEAEVAAGDGTALTDPILSGDPSVGLDAAGEIAADELPAGKAADLSGARSLGSFDPIPASYVVPTDLKVPVALQSEVEKGNALALFEIASRYGEGRGIDVDPAKAFEWYQMSADLGFAPAQYRVGNMLEKGIGTTVNPGEAKTWYQMAAGQGNASAMHNLAVLFAVGADGQPDNDSAALWFTKAANLGVQDSQYNLAILAAQGIGVPQDLEASYKWFALAAKSGDKDAAAKRDEVFKVLRPEQQERARGTVSLWKPEPLNAETNDIEIPADWRTSNEQTASVDMKKVIQNLQLILAKNKYDPGPADGVMGERTVKAIKQFQADNGLEANGKIDQGLVAVLLKKNS
jgi:localization factor PodJL